MSTFGSTTEDAGGSMRDVHKAKLTMGEIATVQGVATQMKVLKAMVDDMTEQHNRVIGMIGTLRAEFQQYQQQRAIELQSWIAKNGGSTTPEDN
jgi:signal transduction protein with GAF and PtsI domain